MIVDDAPVVRRALGDLISEIEGLTVAGWAGGVQEGRDKLRLLEPDVVILDIQLPDGSGLDLLRGFAAGEPRPAVVIVFSSVSASYRRTCLKLGADFVCDKPLELAQLEDLLRQLAVNPPT